MARIKNLFINSLRFPVIWIGAIYLFRFILTPIPIDKYFSNGILLLGIYFVITVLEKLSGSNKILSIILFICLLPFSAVAVITQLYLIGGTFGWSGGEIIYIPLILLFSGRAAYDFYQTPTSNNKTFRILLFIAIFPILALNVSHSATYFPHVDDQITVGNARYYLVYGIDEDIDARTHFILYKCRKGSFECDEIYRTGHQMFVDKLIYDKVKSEVSIIDSDYEMGMAFTYGKNPRIYDGRAVEFGDHVYQLSIKYEYGICGNTDCGIDAYIYTMYECNSDYTSCDMLPIQYRQTSVWGVRLNVNKDTNEIEAYDLDNMLIFTYGESPTCYVDDCVILDK